MENFKKITECIKFSVIYTFESDKKYKVNHPTTLIVVCNKNFEIDKLI